PRCHARVRVRARANRRLALGAAGTAQVAPAAELPLRLGAFPPMAGMPVGAVRMPLLAGIAMLPVLTFAATMGLGRNSHRLRLGRRLQPLERFGDGSEVRGKRWGRNPLARGALDVPQIAALVRTAESNRDAIRSSASRAADAMDIL